LLSEDPYLVEGLQIADKSTFKSKVTIPKIKNEFIGLLVG